jgi:hypothetical protein
MHCQCIHQKNRWFKTQEASSGIYETPELTSQHQAAGPG